ncbi:hypothetical protein L9F63_017815, partial [Diploptera punctata]
NSYNNRSLFVVVCHIGQTYVCLSLRLKWLTWQNITTPKSCFHVRHEVFKSNIPNKFANLRPSKSLPSLFLPI